MKIVNTKFKDLKIISQKINSDSRGNLRETFRRKIINNLHQREFKEIELNHMYADN